MNDSFIPETAETLSFQLLLSQLLAVIGPPAKATKCLESSFSNAADVYEFWLAVQAAFLDVSQKNSVKLPTSVLEKIRRLCNYRFNQMINEGPSDIFITAYFLVPSESRTFVSRFCLILQQIPGALLYSRRSTHSPSRPSESSILHLRVIYMLPSMRRRMKLSHESVNSLFHSCGWSMS